jgi:hypothetical protein
MVNGSVFFERVLILTLLVIGEALKARWKVSPVVESMALVRASILPLILETCGKKRSNDCYVFGTALAARFLRKFEIP